MFNTSPIPQLETIGTQLTKDIYNYYESLKKRVVTFSELETQRKLIFLKSHSSYGDTYFKLPKNITVCFLTGVNKYGFTDFVNKGGMFTRKYGKKRRARYFNSIFSYHLNYFDREEFNCERLEANHIQMDYFRESTWYFPNQLCSNSTIYMNLNEYVEKSKYFGFTGVDETEYLETPYNDFLDNHFKTRRKSTFNYKLEDVIRFPFFEPHFQYLVILDGCRMYPYHEQNFMHHNQYNFIHYQITQKVCRDVLQEKESAGRQTTEFMEIPDFTTASRPRDYLLKGVIYQEDREILKRKMNYNYFSFNNHILSYLIKKLLNVGYQNDIFYRKFKWFVSTLNYDKMLLLYEKLLELQEPRIDPGVVRKIMATDMLRYKFESLCIGLDNLLGNKPEEYTLFEKFDFDIITSLMERSEKFIVLLNQFSEKRILGNFEKSFPSFAGINFFNNSLLSQSVNGNSLNKKGLRPQTPQTLIVNVTRGTLINDIIITLGKCVHQERVVFYNCNFGGRKKYFRNKEIEHLMLVRCKQFFNTEINSITKCFEIHHLENKMQAVFDTAMAESLILHQVETDRLLIRGSVLTHLNLELKSTSTLAESFYCPKLQVFNLKFDRYSLVTNFSLPHSLYLRELSLHNINFANNTMWNFNEFRMLTKLTLERFKFNNNFSSISMLRNIEFISFKGIQNLVNNTLPQSLLKAKKLNHLDLFMVDSFGEVTDELIQMLLRNKVHVDADGSVERLSHIRFF